MMVPRAAGAAQVVAKAAAAPSTRVAAAEIAVEPINEVYTHAWESGNLPRQDLRNETDKQYIRISRMGAVPKKPHKFISRHLPGNEKTLIRTIDLMRGEMIRRYAA